MNPINRPRRVTILMLAVLSIAGLCTARFILSLQAWAFLVELPGVSPLYQALTGLLGAALGWPLVWGLWRGQRWTPSLMRRAALAFAAFEILERLLLVKLPQPDWPFILVFLALSLAFVWWSLSGPAKLFFGEVYERTS